MSLLLVSARCKSKLFGLHRIHDLASVVLRLQALLQGTFVGLGPRV